MEKEEQEANQRVQIPKAVFDGLEFIRRSGVTNMLDRPVVLLLAREWDFTDTAEWIENVDTGTYARLIFQGPEVTEDDRTDQEIEPDPGHQGSETTPSTQVEESEAINETDEIDMIDIALHTVTGHMHDLVTTLRKQAVLTLADTYDTERLGVRFAPSRRDVITAERDALIRSLGHASSLWLQLEKTLIEVQRGVGSLHYLADPEND